MKRLACLVFVAAVACVLIAQSPAWSFELGAGLAYFQESEETAPFIGAAIEVSPTIAFGPSWVRDGDTNHVDAEFMLDVYQIEDVAAIYVHAGAGLAWDDFDRSDAELAYGVGFKSDVAGFVGRLGYTARTEGGSSDTDSSYHVGLFLKR